VFYDNHFSKAALNHWGLFETIVKSGITNKQQITHLVNLCINMQYSSKINEVKFTLIF